MAEDLARRLADKQRKRFIAGVLGAAEQSPWWGKLQTSEQRAYREKILGSVGVYHDFMLDVLGVTSEDSIRNDYALELIQQIHEGQRALERQLVNGK